jgi:hypothetical protein
MWIVHIRDGYDDYVKLFTDYIVAMSFYKSKILERGDSLDFNHYQECYEAHGRPFNKSSVLDEILDDLKQYTTADLTQLIEGDFISFV